MNISVFPFYMFPYLVQIVWNKKYIAMYYKNTIYSIITVFILKTNLFCIVQVSH